MDLRNDGESFDNEPITDADWNLFSPHTSAAVVRWRSHVRFKDPPTPGTCHA